MEELTQYQGPDFAVLVAVYTASDADSRQYSGFPINLSLWHSTFTAGIGLAACLSVVSRYASYGNWSSRSV